MNNVYHSIRRMNVTIKGIIGELMFKYEKKNVFVTRICTIDLLKNLPFEIPNNIFSFLEEYWYSIDAFEFIADKMGNDYFYKGIILYEVKVVNFDDNNGRQKMMPFTGNQVRIYKEALTMGIEVKIAKILLFDNWRFTVSILDFNPERYKYKISDGGNFYKKI